MNRIAIYPICILLWICSSCSRIEPPTALEVVLSRNPALEVVLERYASDSLKRKAAAFLICQLPYHHGYAEEQLEAHLKQYELFGTGELTLGEVRDSVRALYGWNSLRSVQPVSDVEISPDYLIDNIEWAFRVWREQPWGRQISFENFCEYILPYRLADEPLKPWREKVYKAFNPLLDSIRRLPEAADPLFAARALVDSVAKQPFRFSSALGDGPHVGPDLVDWNSGNCREMTDRLTYIFRAVGIPCGCDYLPLRGDANVSHFWNFTLDSLGNTYFMDGYQAPMPARHFWSIKSKVYRQTFSRNETLSRAMEKQQHDFYPGLYPPLYIDVTRQYSGKYARTLEIPVDKLYRVPKDGVVYLCGAAWQEWVPLAWTCVQEGYLSFDHVEGGVILLLAAYEQGKLSPVSDPFEFNKETGGIHYFVAGEAQEDVVLLNKYHQFIEPFPYRMINGVFEGSNSPDFARRDTLAIVTDLPVRLHNILRPDVRKAYRYLRYYGPDNAYCNVSEVGFYESLADSLPLTGQVLGTPNGTHGDGKHDYTNVYDGDPYTSFDYYQPSGGWAGLDLGRPHQVGKIVFTPRNRDNYIRAGDEYELFYAVRGEWKSAGRQMAAADSLLYTVPRGTLLYLKNLNRGKDERIFEYLDGKQRYW